MGPRFSPEKRAWLRTHFGLPASADGETAAETARQAAREHAGDVPHDAPCPAESREEAPTRTCHACQGRMHRTRRDDRPSVRTVLQWPLYLLEEAQPGIVRTSGRKPDEPGLDAARGPPVKPPVQLLLPAVAQVMSETIWSVAWNGH